jgi:hypothetical protein
MAANLQSATISGLTENNSEPSGRSRPIYDVPADIDRRSEAAIRS